MSCRLAIVLASLAGLLALPAIAAADEIEWMYDPDQVVEIRLGDLSEEELDELEVEPSEEVRGTFELLVDGVPKGPLLEDVGIRRKGGFGSSRPIKTGKSGLKVRFDKFVKGQLFYGIKRLTLNNMFQDRSMLHETLTYELFHALDLPASRTGYAFVTLNGEDYGLFLNLETLDEISLPQWFPTTQHLFEADAPGTDVRPGQAETFEVDEGEETELGDLEALIAAANAEEGDWSEGMAAVADLEAMATHWAVERYVGHWDGYAGSAEETPDPEPIRPNNYYLHSDEAGIFQLMPWGTDQAWEYFNFQFDEEAGGLMFNKCLADASCKDLYLDSLTEIHCLTSELGQAAHAAELAAMLAPYQGMEDPLRRGYTAEQIAAAVEDAEEFPELRGERLVAYLTDEGRLGEGLDPCAPPDVPGTPDDGSPDPDDVPPAAGPAPPTPAGVKIGRSKVRGAFVVTRLHATGPARVSKRVFAWIDGKRRHICVDRSQRDAAGRHTVSCRLPKWALRRLEQRPLRLTVLVGFTPDFGASRLARRSLLVPQR